MNNTKTTVSLSNEGYGDFYKEMPVLEAHPYINSAGKLRFELKNERRLKVILKIDEFISYSRKLNQVIKGNKIGHEDKVFFAANSSIPRTSFNRYSNKARRVEKEDKATKIVIGSVPTIVTMYNTSEAYLLNGTKLIKYDPRSIVDKLGKLAEELLEKGEASNKDLPELIKYFYQISSFSYYRTTYTQTNHIVKEAKKIIEGQFKDNISLINYKFVDGEFASKDIKTMDVLANGHKITSLVTDDAVVEYLDGYKDGLDENTYNMLLSMFTNNIDQLSIGIKLLENMNITESKPYMYALFFNAMSANRYNIVSHKAYKGIGFANIINTFELKSLSNILSGYGSSVSEGMIRFASSVITKLKTNEDKELFKRLIHNTIKKYFIQVIGAAAYNIYIQQDENT